MATLDHIGLNRYIYMSSSSETMTLGSHTVNDISNSSGNSILGENLDDSRLLLGVNLYNNGPYGYSSWQQTRMSHNPLSRHLRKNNQFAIVENGKERIIVSEGKRSVVSERHGSQLVLDEPSVVSSFKPMKLFGTVDVYNQEGLPFPKGLVKKISLDNNSAYFTNIKINGITGISEKTDRFYDILKNYYLEDNLNSADSPLSSFEKLIYSQTIYPPQQYTYKSYTRRRTTFSFNWNSNILVRQQGPFVSNNFGRTIASSSIWPLDVDPNWINLNGSRYLGLRKNQGPDISGVYLQVPSFITSSFGILWNHYSQFATELGHVGTTVSPAGAMGGDMKLAPGPIYSRRHDLPQSGSVTAPSGRTELRASSHLMSSGIFGGEAAWDVPKHSQKYPFYDSYPEASNEISKKAKNFTIVPEFRMSEHVESFLSDSSLNTPLSLFELTGARGGVTNSSADDFYTIYSNSDFLKNFEVVLEDHKDFTDPSRLTLKCKAYKKLIPYNGFYPVQRSVNLSEQFYSSYRDFLEVSSSTFTFGSFSQTTENNYTFQTLLAPLFAPGVLFNSIKAGVACDYPIRPTFPNNFGNAEPYSSSDGGDTYLLGSDTVFTQRIPFEALIEPEKYLANTRIIHAEPHPSGNLSSSVFWDGNGDRLYSLMANNFLAEIPNFFLKNKRNTTLASLPQNDPNFGQSRESLYGTGPECYTMRVKMYRSMDRPNSSIIHSGPAGPLRRYIPPQDLVKSGRKETMTMYSRPSAFGPPTMYQITTTRNQDPEALFDNKIHSAAGFNYPFTPPYYHGQAWADITFKPDGRRKYTLSEILASASVEYYRFDKEMYTTDSGSNDGDKINENAMQLNASLNLLSKGVIRETSGDVDFNIQIDDQSKARWIIQPKFETPILNFADYVSNTGHNGNVTLPTDPLRASQVPVGMWHQYGRLPTEAEGIYLQVTDIPRDWVNGRLGIFANTDKTGSLAELCGFSQNPVKLGQVSEQKKISECVVAVPFIEERGVKQFFKLDLNPANLAINEFDGADETFVDLVDKLKRFIFPPSFDFVNFPENVDPIAMYVFEFSTQLSQQDLTDIWQNVLPDIGRQDEVAEASISHSLIGNGRLINKKSLREDIRWMVFKVKQRAAARYYDQVFSKKGDTTSEILADDIEVDQAGLRSKIQYNWPYDFFSLVELVKIDASIEFSDVETDDNGEEQTRPRVAREQNRIRQLDTLFPRDEQ